MKLKSIAAASIAALGVSAANAALDTVIAIVYRPIPKLAFAGLILCLLPDEKSRSDRDGNRTLHAIQNNASLPEMELGMTAPASHFAVSSTCRQRRDEQQLE